MNDSWSPVDFFYQAGDWDETFGRAFRGAAIVCVVALGDDIRFAPTRWAPVWALPAGVGTAVLWGIGMATPVYDETAGTRSCFDTTEGFAVGTVPVIGVLAAAVAVATTLLDRGAGRGMLLDTGAFVLVVEGIQVATALGLSDDSRGAGVLWMHLPATAFLTTTGLAVRRPRPA